VGLDAKGGRAGGWLLAIITALVGAKPTLPILACARHLR